MSRIDILREPRGPDYRALLRFMTPRARSFSLVWRHQLRHGPSADAIHARMEPDLLNVVETAAWPGTVLYGGELALVRFYRVTAETMAVLAEASGLYSWRVPERPEDLAFYGEGDQVLLGSIAHERDAWFEAGMIAEADVRASLPTLAIRVADGSDLGTDA